MDGSAGATATETPIGSALSPAFLDAVRWVIDHAEGGGKLVEDQGGLTRWGISQRAYPAEDIANLSRQRAEMLYLMDYWKPLRGNALPPALAFVLFDTAVNMGVGAAAKVLQGALHITQDGIVGPETVSRAKQYYPRHELVARFLELRLRFYEALAAKFEHHRGSLYGWRMRVLRLAEEAGAWRALWRDDVKRDQHGSA